MEDCDRLGVAVKQLRRMQTELEAVHNRSYHHSDKVQCTLDGLIGRLPGLCHFLAGDREDLSWEDSFEKHQREEQRRREGLMIELQRIPDPRPLFAKVMTLPDLLSKGDEHDGRWEEMWTGFGYTPRQCKLLGSAFAGIEEAWIVFWESGDPDRALWRLVDAAGLLAEVFPKDRSEATGRGYRIEKVTAWHTKGHRWGSSLPSGEERQVPSPEPKRRGRRQRVTADPPRLKPKPVALDPRRAFSAMQKAEIFLRSNGHCCACGIELDVQGVWHADHIVPHAWGGLTEVRNGQALCQPCNARKRDKVLTVDEG